MSRIDRRSVLKAGGALAATALTGCSTTNPASTKSSAGSLAVAGPDWAGFSRGLDGTLYRPGDTGYAASHQLFNPRFDSVNPAGVVRAASVNDVREAIVFARNNKLVCVPRSGGHSYVGASTIANGLVIDVTALRGITYANNAVQIGAGAKLYDVHVALDRYGRSLPTGTCPTVGVAGLALGGGMGIHTRTYGLTSDRILSMQVVTADGGVRTAGPTQNADLYWALRGGGGGNLGIVTSFRLATIGAGKLGFFRLSWPESKAAAVLQGWQRFAKEAPYTAWANLHVTAESNGTLSIHAVGVSTTGSAAAAAAQLESLAGTKATGRTVTVKTHMEAVRYLGGGSTSPRTGFLAGSDVLRGPLDATTGTALIGVVKAAARAKVAGSAILDPLGGQAAKEPPGGSAWPWRSALGVVQWYAGLPTPPSTAALRAAQNFVSSGHRAIAKTSAGGYVNYVEAGRSVNSYYGANLGRLHAVKQKYDPANFFHTSYTLN
ncbi:FAD/FMN-containing dehydrogenase [Kribbella amoyensis]|uniref:FAD/FMN-containing dehydrogenase n=1 Tax=Kribbella amoyensis TaxID=996641 RepID=A0A561C182_9ACTN|nr:FAD-binding oxidoreductase [Kribbella amoyensis]TWD84848.1 FAD/FMN-containing dehydrogenase [Kribbella amoyensis]